MPRLCASGRCHNGSIIMTALFRQHFTAVLADTDPISGTVRSRTGKTPQCSPMFASADIADCLGRAGGHATVVGFKLFLGTAVGAVAHVLLIIVEVPLRHAEMLIGRIFIPPAANLAVGAAGAVAGLFSLLAALVAFIPACKSPTAAPFVNPVRMTGGAFRIG